MTLTAPRASSRSPEPGGRKPRYESPQRLMANGKPFPSAGDVVGDWIEEYLVCGEGDQLGEPVRLGRFQRRMLRRLYEYNPATGQLLHDRALFGMAKGNGKTGLSGDIGLAELCGPIAPISPNIPVSAASWDQASRLFEAARLAIEGDGDQQRGPLSPWFLPGLHLLEDKILHPQREGRLYRIAAVGGTNDGGHPTCHLGDELHEWEGERRERVYIVQGKSLKKRRAPRPLTADVVARLPIPVEVLYGTLQIGISTAGPDLDSLLGRLYTHGVRVAAGEIEDPGFLFMWWEADERWDLEDPEQRRTAFLEGNPAIDDGEFLTLATVESAYRDPTIARHELERYNLNRWAVAPDRWISRQAWGNARHPEALGQAPDDVPIAAGFDGSDVDDATSLVGCTIPQAPGERPHLFQIRTWERDVHDANWTVPRAEVDAAIAELMGRWQVRTLGCDEARWQSDIERWAGEYGADVVLKVPQTHERMAPMADRLRAAVLHRAVETEDPDPLVTHDGDPILARHIGNAHTRLTRWGLSIRKDRPDSGRKIDAAIAACIAFDEATRPQKRRARRLSTFRSM